MKHGGMGPNSCDKHLVIGQSKPKTHMLDDDQIQDELKVEFRRDLQKESANYTSATEISVESVIDPYRYSDVMKLFHVTALFLKFIHNLKAT